MYRSVCVAIGVVVVLGKNLYTKTPNFHFHALEFWLQS